METIIRKARLSDIEDLVELLRQLFFLETDFNFDAERQKQGLLLMLDSSQTRCVMVAESNQEIIGMCTAQLLVSTAQGTLSGLIEDMVVHHDHRGKGLGSRLLQSVELWSIASGASRIQLLADKQNVTALNFYKNRQWRSTQLICLRKS
ncbi:MAG: GNAT family N-acetyltransferase [Desulfobacterales bacterium]